MTVSWQILVPVRGGLAPKSRLAEAVPNAPDRVELALAFSADVVAAALRAPGVRGVTVVTGDARTGERLAAMGAATLDERDAAGLDAAVRLGAEHLMRRHPGDGIAVLMGDLPRITPEALAEALVAAASVERGVLGDRDGTGTALLTAMPGHVLRPAYGEGSFVRHVQAGHAPLAVPAHHSPLWHDIDTPADLMRTLEDASGSTPGHGIGPHTRAALARITLGTP